MEMYLNTNTLAFTKYKYTYKYFFAKYLHTNTNTLKSILNTNAYIFRLGCFQKLLRMTKYILKRQLYDLIDL